MADVKSPDNVEQPLASAPQTAVEEIDTSVSSSKPEDANEQTTESRTWRFWLVFVSLCLALLIVSLDITIMSVALPTIAKAVPGADEQYVWISSSFLLASTVVQPFIGQLANIFGRRWPMLISVALFIVGSAIIGSANNVNQIIGGRTVQGLGGGGQFVLVEIIACDMVPLRERGKYLGMVLSAGAVGSTLGPIIGGVIAQNNWRWIFYMNLPIGGVCLVTQTFFLRLNYRKQSSWLHALGKIDYIGGFLFIASMSAILLGLTMGGTVYLWSRYNIIVPLVLGFVGWIAFHIYEATPFCKEPSVPPHLFANRTSLIGFFLGFDAALLLMWACVFLPVYYQGVLETSPLRAGVYLLPFMLFNVPSGMVAGGLMAKLGQYKPFHHVGFALSAIGFGLFTLLGPSSSKAAWACFEIIASIGLGILMITVLPGIQANLSDADNASSAALFSFMRSFGFMWGIAIPAIIFNNETNGLLHLVRDPQTAAALAGGKAYSLVTGGFVQSLAPETRREVIHVLTEGLKPVWYGGVAFSILGFLLSFLEKHVPMRTQLNTEYGLEEEKKQKDPES
ncbi:putative efflux pump antibiotic resistance protein [Westerdykella ornata]|uniref:Putative efflux pump antibiotic resistance protein n=1 Tax=Westerdykella ornata TaxID=318751 RepID=A0A6A6JLW6_WESOR|nr:putative efflux pump antibiotic resistance protein [Westerdykella ornata]KAF2276646.1 putative efflux pump antibiotic resistance protein [Westerdykella ornata]